METARTQRPPHIQRLKSRSRDNQVRFSERYEFDYMGNSYFETGECAKRIREMTAEGAFATGETAIAGFKVLFAYNPNNYDEAVAIETLRTIYDRGQDWWIEEDPYFDYQTVSCVTKALKDRAQWKAMGIDSPVPAYHAVDAWFDITYGLFWTIDKINIRDILLNFRHSVTEWDARRAAREKA